MIVWPAPIIMLRHVLPNAMGSVLVIATINLGLPVITERRCRSSAPACRNHALARHPDPIGNNYLFAGELVDRGFPGIALAG